MCDSDSGSDIISVPLSKKWHEIASTSFPSLFDDDDTDTEDVNGSDELVDATTTTTTHAKEIQSVNEGAKNHKRRRCAHLSDELGVLPDSSPSNSVCSSDGSGTFVSHSSFPRAA